MKVKAIKTRIFLPPKDDLFSLIKESFRGLKIKERSIIVVTSKVVAIGQGRCLPIDSIKKEDLIKQEADFFIDHNCVPGGYLLLTLKNDILIPNAGVDESNANGYYVLWPDNPHSAAKKIHRFIKKTFKLKELGIIISDSHCTPLTNGITGFAIGCYGFNPLRDYRGKKDLFGRILKMTQTNIADSIAMAAVFAMGEGNEQTPIALIEDVGSVIFGSYPKTGDTLVIKRENDIYGPLVNTTLWKKS